jgi:putative transcriptional regulator
LPKKNQNLLLQNKGEFTKFQILLEVMHNQPHIKQKEIADTMGITIQAISKYFKKLTKEGLLEAGSGRADYHLTRKGIGKLHDDLKSLERYVTFIKSQIKIEHAWPAIATQPIKAGQTVGLIVKEGVMHTVDPNSPITELTGIAMADAAVGEDLGLKNLQGKMNIKQGKILIVKLPSIRQGGSRAADITKVRALYDEFKPDRIAVMGAVGRAVLNKLKLKADIEFGISHAVAIAASRGLKVFVLVVGRMTNRMTQEIENVNMKSAANISYEVRDAKTSQPNSPREMK